MGLRGGALRQAGPDFTLWEVTFAHDAPPSVAEHARIFEVPVRFGQPVEAMVFDRAHLDLPCSGSDPELVAECQTTYVDLVAAVRRELAATHLADPDLAIAEEAFALGYAEVSAFHRAFRGWTGTTPAAFRRERAPG